MARRQGEFGPRSRFHVGRWHVVIRVGAVVTGVQVEERHRVEVRHHGAAGPVLVEDGQEGERAVDLGGIQLARDEPGVRLLVGMFAFGGGELQLVVAGYQLERVAAPVVVHLAPHVGVRRLPEPLFLLC